MHALKSSHADEPADGLRIERMSRLLAAAEARADRAEARADRAEARADRADAALASPTGSDGPQELAERYRALIAHLPDTLMVLFDPELRYQIVGGGALADRHLFAEAQGKTVREIFEPEVARHLEPMYRATLSGERNEREVEYDGRTYLVQQQPIRDASGEVEAGLILWRDISRVKQAERDLLVERQALQEALQQRDVLLQEVYHRVKNNLQVVRSLLSLQRRRLTDSTARHALHTAGERIEAMARLHELLYRTTGLERLDFADYLVNLVQDLKTSYCRDVGPEIDVIASGLPLRLDRAVPLGLLVHELVANALQHAWPTGRPGHLSIRLSADGDQTTLIVADDGSGLPSADDRRSGALGLVLVEQLTDQLGGEIEAHAGGGTRWTLRLGPDGSAL